MHLEDRCRRACGGGRRRLTAALGAGLLASLLTVVVVGSTGAATGTPATAIGARTAVASMYWGAMVDLQVPTAAAFKRGGTFAEFERKAHKKMSLIHWAQPWKWQGELVGFPRGYLDNVRDHGSIPVLDWGAWELGRGIRQPKFQSQDIVSGRYDAFIRKWATRAKDWGHPFILRFNHEMNGWWYPWGEGRKQPGGKIVNGNRPGDYVRAWRHVHKIFDSVGADNVTWMWSPNYMTPSSRYGSLSSMYPGDKYVDWTAFSAYNRDDWLTPYSMITGIGSGYLANIYQAILDVAPRKPMMLAETASIESAWNPKAKAEWIKDLLLTQLPLNFPKIKGFMWFDGNELRYPTQTVSSSRASQRAFADAIGSSRYAANEFSARASSPIRPLRPSSGPS